jgi:hypothetical protein
VPTPDEPDEPDDIGTPESDKPGATEPPVPAAPADQPLDQPPVQAAPPEAPAAPDQLPVQATPPAPHGPPSPIVVPPFAPGGIVQVEVPPGSAGGVDVQGDVKKQRLSGTQRAGFQLAVMVGTLIGVVTILVIVQWWRSAPWIGVPSNFSDMDGDKAKAVAENLKILSDTSLDRSMKLFDDIVGRVLLPVFTSILGYIFGTRGGDSSNPPNSQK